MNQQPATSNQQPVIKEKTMPDKKGVVAGNYYELAEHLYSLGFSVLPLSHKKTPVVKWKQLQTERCSPAKLVEWFRDRGFRPGIVTGELSRVVVVDCDSAEATAYVEAAGATSPTQQQTRRGRHYLFRHPGCDTRNRRSVGGRAVDVRGDGGYVVAYEDAGSWTSGDIEDAPMYVEL